MEEFPYVLRITEALHRVVRNLVDNVPLPPWEEFQAPLEKVEGLKLMNDSRTSKTDNFSTKSWIDEVKNTKTSCCLDITSHDLRTLLPGHCLNDVVVNSTLELLAGESSVSSGVIYTWNSLLFTNIAGGEDVSQWTIKAAMNSLFDYDFHLVPINLTGHWMLAKDLEKWIGDNDMVDAVPRSAFRYICCKEVPHEQNGYDCGVVVLWVASRLIRNLTLDGAEEVNWTQERERIARLLHQAYNIVPVEDKYRYITNR
ncbi:hypothetical protein BKA61DRAFT_693906 [Leptodontidium sp. MPI-SDFR-AT-0119]|nr:hypothetical protein BKA61DRAFT_693906 [Leptodontidium sp. MPI-SDFR-AT-0119]